jgi:hypothetical protein
MAGNLMKYSNYFLTYVLLVLVFPFNLIHLVGYLSNYSQRAKKNVNVFNLSFLIPVRDPHYEFILEEIKNLGYFLRFKAGQVNPIVYRVDSTQQIELFHRAEFRFFNKDAPRRVSEEALPKMLSFAKILTEKGIRLIIVPIPPKSFIERNKLPDPLPHEDLWSINSFATNNKNEEQPQLASDLFSKSSPYFLALDSVFQNFSKENPDRKLYIPWDNHWSSQGIALTAQAVLQKISPSPASLRFLREMLPNYAFKLLITYQLPDKYWSSLPQMQWKEPLYTLSKTDKPPHKGRVVIAADSFGERLQSDKLDLASVLSSHFQDGCESFSVSAGGIQGAFEEMRKKGFKLRRNDTLVWTFESFKIVPKDYQFPEDIFENN